MFQLHPTLARDCAHVCALELCQVLLMDDANYPWLILVPQRASVREIYELPGPDRALLTAECCQAGLALQALFEPDKINTAALGNQVSQLHIHVIARFQGDPAWPAPVWGHVPPKPYTGELLAQTILRLQETLRHTGAEAADLR